MDELRFVVERADERCIELRDRYTGLIFSFPISHRNFDATLYTRTGSGHEIKPPPDETTKKQARAFAEEEARKRGWID
jgi:hypothetical protein